jgi:hypothetical protein
MESRTIRIIDKSRLDNALAAARLVPLDGTVEIVIKNYIRNRSLSQNSLLHMWRSDISNCTGETIAEVRLRLNKAHMMPILLASQEPKDLVVLQTICKLRRAYTIGSKAEVEDISNQYISLLSSKDLNVKQFAGFLTCIENECGQQGIMIRRPDDFEWIMGRK